MTPHFELGCKRMLISNDWYPTLARDDVDLVTDRIDKITPHGIVTADGTEREIDVLVVATGFLATDLPDRPAHPRPGRGPPWPSTSREHGMQAYKGATVHGFPNLFFVVGPNTGLGHSSMVFMIESQVAYAVDALRTMRSRASAPSSPPRRRSRPGTTTCSAGCGAPCGAPAAARAGTSTPTAATSRSGPGRRTRSGG